MICTFLRSSSYNRYDWCQHLFYLEYVLGYKSPSNFKAEKGNIIHKVMEMLALCQLGKQNKKDVICEEGIGEIKVNDFDVEDLFHRSVEYYTKKSIHIYQDKDIRECKKWLDKAL